LPEPQIRLLFDENLAARLVEELVDVFPSSFHVGAVGLAAASDRAIWEHAREAGLVIISKDVDFLRLSVLNGPPPKVIWLRLGNCTTDDVIRLLRQRRTDIERFVAEPEAGFLALA